MTRKTPAAAARSLDAVVRALADDAAVAAAFGTELARQANVAGQGRSTPPQARLVAGAIYYDDLAIRAHDRPAGRGTVAELLLGAEFGSARFTQFGPRASGGYWLFPTLRNPPTTVVAAGERGLDELIGGAL